jgi:hypothetical protein
LRSKEPQLLGFGFAFISISESVQLLEGRILADVSSSEKKPTQAFYDNSDSALSYSGQWSNNTVQGIPNSTVTAPFHQTVDEGASVRMNFSNASAVALYGSTNFGHELYSIVSWFDFFHVGC